MTDLENARQMPPRAYSQLVDDLHGFGGGRVWSLMVSLFGDLAQHKGAGIDGPVLSALMAEMRVKPEAVRVALHRLRNDGWIVSEKTGRTRRHSLTPTSRKESIAASARIYAAPGEGPSGWRMVMLESPDRTTPEKMAKRGFVPIQPRLYIGSDAAKPPKHALLLVGRTVPDWLRDQLAPTLSAGDYDTLFQILSRTGPRLDIETLDPLHYAVLRCLIVHNWRRLVLRHPALPAAVLPRNWAGYRCHLLVHDLLTRLPCPSPETIRPAETAASFTSDQGTV